MRLDSLEWVSCGVGQLWSCIPLVCCDLVESEDTDSEMSGTGDRWKLFQNPKGAKDDSRTEKRSKSKKFQPTRAAQPSLQKSLKSLSQSRFSNISVIEPAAPPKADDSIQLSRMDRGPRLDLGIQLKRVPMMDDGSELSSPGSPVIDRQLSKIRRQIVKERRQSQIRFSLDEEHQYLHRELNKIKEQFSNFKKMIVEELLSQKKIINEISHQMSMRLDECLEKARQSAEGSKILVKPAVFEEGSSIQQDIKINLESTKNQLNKLVNSMEYRDGGHRKNKQLQQEDNRLMTSMKSLNRSGGGGDEINGLRPRVNSSHREKSKKEFSKLFEAMTCLKNDIKSLGNVKAETNNQKQPAPNNMAKTMPTMKK